MSLISKDQGVHSLLIAQNGFYVQCTCSLNSTNKKDDIRYVNHFMCLISFKAKWVHYTSLVASFC